MFRYLASSLIPYTAISIVQKLIRDRCLVGDDLVLLEQCSPVLRQAILAPEVLDAEGKLKPDLLPLLVTLLLIADAPRKERSQDSKDTFEKITPDPTRSVNKEWWNSAEYHPSHPRCRRQVCRHAADKYTKSATGTCRKCAPTKGKSMPGLLIVYCVEHSCIIGFEMMDFAESPRTVYRLLSTRWGELPAVVFYDNACNVHTFVHYREPELFKNVQFLIDGLHWSAHISCSPVFNPNLYTHLSHLNTQLCEQLNSELKRLAPHLWFFNRQNFLFHLRSDLYWLNTKKRAALHARNAYTNNNTSDSDSDTH